MYSGNDFKRMMYSFRYHPESETRKFYVENRQLRATTQKEDQNLMYRTAEIWGKLTEQSVCRIKLNCELCTKFRNDYITHNTRIEAMMKESKLQGCRLSKREAHYDLLEKTVLTDILKQICEKNRVKMMDYLYTMSAKHPKLYKRAFRGVSIT